MFKRAFTEKFIIIYVSSGLTMDVENNRIMVDTIESFNPSYWSLKNPEGYLVYFRSKNKKNCHLSKSLYDSVKMLIINNDLFKEFKIGTSEGVVVTEIDLFGRVCFEPLGGAVNDAYKAQKGRADLIG